MSTVKAWLTPFPVAPPHVKPYKESEHGNEDDKGVLVCVSHSYPPPTDWTWYKVGENDETEVRILSFSVSVGVCLFVCLFWFILFRKKEKRPT